MQRTLVIGNCGAGKSTFSNRLSQLTGLELIHLDQHYWKLNWQEPDPLDWKHSVDQLAAKSHWIMDGNYGGTMDARIQRADTLVFLDYPTAICLWRVTKRTLKYWRSVRPDMVAGCKERFDWNFYRYVATFNRERRGSLLHKLDKYKAQKQVMTFRTDKEAVSYLKKLSEANSINV